MATNEEKHREESIKKIQAEETSKLREIMHRFHVADMFDLHKPGENHEEMIFVLLKYIEGKTTVTIKEGIYRMLSGVKWLSNAKLIELLDSLFEHFENNNMQFIDCSTPEALVFFQSKPEYEGIRSMDELYAIHVRSMIGSTICELIKPKKSHYERYFQRLKTIVTDKSYRGRLGMVEAYAKLGKQEAVHDLIGLLDGWDLDVLDSTIKSLGKLKAKEAAPYLTELLKHEDSYFRGIARKALSRMA